MTNWRNFNFQTPRVNEEHWIDTFSGAYPAVGRQANRICERAGTFEADTRILEQGGALLADYHDWAMRAKLAMFSRKAIAFDGLCREIEEITADMVRGDVARDNDHGPIPTEDEIDAAWDRRIAKEI